MCLLPGSLSAHLTCFQTRPDSSNDSSRFDSVLIANRLMTRLEVERTGSFPGGFTSSSRDQKLWRPAIEPRARDQLPAFAPSQPWSDCTPPLREGRILRPPLANFSHRLVNFPRQTCGKLAVFAFRDRCPAVKTLDSRTRLRNGWRLRLML